MPDSLYTFIASGQDGVVSAYKSIEQAASASAATVEKTYAKTERAASKTAKTKVQTEQQASEEVRRTYEKLEADWEKSLAKEVAATQRAADRKAQIEERASARMEKSRQRGMSRALGMGTQLAVGLARQVSSGVTDMIGGAVRESFQLGDIARRVSINARMPGEAAVDPGQLKKEFEQTAIKTPGISSEDIGLAASKYVDLTGDLQAARDNMQTFATVASATGAKVDDVATAAATLGKKFDVKSVDDMQKVMAVLTFQGKGNALMMKDLAGQFQKLAAAGSAFGLGTGPDAVAKLGGLMQVARGGTKSAQSAGTAVENIFKQLIAKPQLSKYVYGKNGQKKDIDQILVDTISGVGGGNMKNKETQLSKLFGAQGYRGITPLLGEYRKAFEGAGGGKAGEDAGRAAVSEMLRKATEATSDFSQVEQDAAAAQAADSAQLTAAWEQLKANVSAELVPALSQLVPRVVQLVPAIDPAITIMVALAEAAKLAVDALVALGLVHPKTETRQEAAARTAKELEHFEGTAHSVGSMAELDALVDKHNALKTAADAAEEAFMPAPEAGKLSNLSRMVGGESPLDNFVDKYARTQGYEPGSVGYDAASEHAKELQEQISHGEMGDITSNRDSDQSKELIQNAQAQQKADTTKTIADMNEVVTKMNQAADAALKLSRAAGTIIGGP